MRPITIGLILLTVGLFGNIPTPGDKPSIALDPSPALSPTPLKKKQGCTMPQPKNKVQDPPSEELTAENVKNRAKSLDADCDGISNWEDNCTYVYNPGQRDRNKNGIGDACEKKRRPYKKSPSKKGVHS